ncbi:MAG: VCBS repeat-containing protein [Kofleriaceae bacterium]
MRLCVFVLIAACSSDPTLSVTVTHPAGIVVTKTTVTVYESTTVHCSDIEFARLDDAGLQGIATSEAEIESGTATLDGISRLGTKIIVARGYDSNGLVSAGCVEHGEVVGSDSVEITTLTAATVSVHGPDDPTASNGLQLTLTDQTSRPITDGRPVLWTVYGAAGSIAADTSSTTSTSDGEWEPTLPSCANAQGQVTVHPTPPTTLGGYAVQLRVAWAVEEPPMYTTLASPPFSTLAVPPGITLSTTAKRACALRGKQLICVDSSDQAHLWDISVVNAKPSLTANGTQAALLGSPPGQHVIGVYAVPNSNGPPDVYAVSSAGDLVVLFGGTQPTNTPTGCGATLVTNCNDAIFVPTCGSSPAKVLLNLGKYVHAIDARGGNAVDFMLTDTTFARFENAGCVTVLQDGNASLLGQFVTAPVTGTTSASTATHLIGCNATGCRDTDVLLTRGAGVGFTGGTEPRIVGTTVDASGVVLVEAVIGPQGGTIERARMPAVGLPDRIVAGQFDADTDPDLFFDITTRASSSSFELGYARKIGTDNLEALSPAQDFTVEDLLVGDINGDGRDDIVVISDMSFYIIPFGVTLPAQTLTADETCSL